MCRYVPAHSVPTRAALSPENLLPCAMQMQDTLINGPLGKSGFFAAFSLILLSEIGDKTFFIAARLVCFQSLSCAPPAC